MTPPLLVSSVAPDASALVELFHRTPLSILGTLDVCLAIAFLSLWRSARDFPVFRAAGLLFGAVCLEQYAEYAYGFEATWPLRCLPVGFVLATGAEALQVPHRRLIRLFWIVILFSLVAGSFPGMAMVRDLPIVLSEPLLAVFVVVGLRRPKTTDRTIAVAFAGLFLIRLTLAPSLRLVLGIKNAISIGGWQWPLTGSALTLLGAVTLAVFVGELIRDRRDRQRLMTEVEAARAIQQMIIPEEQVSVPGFEVHSVYRPFGELGGDFFQLVPLVDGSMLIAIGDVSGKGVSAAMLVSLLVGSLHTLMESTDSPAELMAGLNRRVLGRSRGGFTTCLIVRVEAKGQCTMANAGHPAAYRNGGEVDSEFVLPLGISADAHYVETVLTLHPGDQLTLLTDGVVEARSAAGELFGFERTASIARQSAEAIADAARAFGQDDDITVLTIARAGAQGW